MKNIIMRVVIGFAVLAGGGFLYWYYDFGGGLGAGGDAESNDEVAIIDSVPADTTKVVSFSPEKKGSSNVPPKNLAQKDAARLSPNPASVDLSVPIIAAQAAPPQTCSFADAVAADPSRKVVFNEIAWMGSLPEASATSTQSSGREWIELKNISADVVSISGWQILNGFGNLKIVFAENAEIQPGGFYLLIRDGKSVGGVLADADYSGTLSNKGDQLALLDAHCGRIRFFRRF